VSALLLNSATMIFQMSTVVILPHTILLSVVLHCINVKVVIYSLTITVQVIE